MNALRQVVVFSFLAITAKDGICQDALNRAALSAATRDVSNHLPSAAESVPSLDETISFMDASVKPERSYVTKTKTCHISVLTNTSHVFVLPEGVHAKSTDKYGVQHFGFSWHVFRNDSGVMQFGLESIDPESIFSKAVASSEFVQKHDVDEYPDELKNPDLFLVFFKTRNAKQVVEYSDLPKPDEHGVLKAAFDRHSDEGQIVFEARDRAERFVTAFKHAVALCGGRETDFAPTPSR